jgi:hypothetical protein
MGCVVPTQHSKNKKVRIPNDIHVHLGAIVSRMLIASCRMKRFLQGESTVRWIVWTATVAVFLDWRWIWNVKSYSTLTSNPKLDNLLLCQERVVQLLIINYKNLVNCQQLQSPCPGTITTTSVARETLKMLMSKTHTQTHTHTIQTHKLQRLQKKNMHLRPLELF